MITSSRREIRSIKRIRSRRCAAGASLALFAVGLAACGSSKSSSSISSTTSIASSTSPSVQHVSFALTFPSLEYLPVYVARDEGFFKKRNISITLDTFSGGGSTVASAFASNSVQMGLGGVDLAASNAKKITDVKVVQQLSQSSFQIYVQKDISSVSQLVGKKITVSSLSGVFYIWWQEVLAAYHIDPSKVVFVSNGSEAGMSAAFLSGVVNAIGDVPPVPASFPPPLVPSDKLPQLPLAVTVANQSFITAHKATVAGVISAINEGTAWIKTHQSLAVSMCESDLDFPSARCQLAPVLHPTSPYTWSSNGAIDVSSLSQALSAEASVYPQLKGYPVDNFIDSSFVGTSPS
ncbi:MAG: ABC transporter substrate-binding protein [Actinomycetota bacterium]|nr:MAG: ABC transporter substrate-binding protein [Actinomycetota bacterium]